MAEAGNPAMAEMQPKPVGVVEKVKGKLREMFTVEGRAEVMAQKQIDIILAQVPEEKRVEAMQILESKRPDLVAGKMEDAKGSLVRNAVIVGASAAALGGVALWKREWIGGHVRSGTDRVLGVFKKPQYGPKTLIDTVMDAAATAKDVGGPGNFPPDKSGLSWRVVRAAQKANEGGQVRVKKVMSNWFGRLKGQKPGLAEQIAKTAQKIPNI